MSFIDRNIERIYKRNVIPDVGWGSWNQDKTQLMLTIQSPRNGVDFEGDEQVTFRVFYQGYTKKNGNASHRIEVNPTLRVPWQSPITLQDKLVLAKADGKLRDFAFTLRRRQIAELRRYMDDDMLKLKLIAEERLKGTVRIIWIEGGKTDLEFG